MGKFLTLTPKNGIPIDGPAREWLDSAERRLEKETEEMIHNLIVFGRHPVEVC